MQTYVANTPVTLTVQFLDTDGNAFTADAVQVRVLDGDDVELMPLTAVPGYVAGSSQATVTIDAAVNAIADTSPRAIRVVELQCASAAGTVTLTQTYIVEVSGGLVVGVNTFQTMAKAELLATSMSNLPAWNAASQQDRRNALIEARQHICQLNFSPLNGNRWWGQDSLNFVPEGVTTVNQVGRDKLMLIWGGNLSFLSPTQFLALPQRFLDQVCLAQIAEAEAILGGDPIEDRRRKGLTLDTIGDTKQMFRTSKPLDLPCSRRALSYLSLFITFTQSLTRG